MVWACGKNEYRMTRRVVMAEVSGGRVRGTPWLCWMDGVKVAFGQQRDDGGGCASKEGWRALVHM